MKRPRSNLYRNRQPAGLAAPRFLPAILAMLTALATLAAAASTAWAQSDDAAVLDPAREAELILSAAENLGVDDLTIQFMELPGKPPAAFEFSLDGAGLTISLRRYSVRADGFQVLVPGVNGELVEVQAPPVQTYRGHVVGVEGSAVSASLNDDGVTAMVHLPDETVLAVQPVSDAVSNAPRGWHAIYFADSVNPGPWLCGNDDLHGAQINPRPPRPEAGSEQRRPEEGPSSVEESDRIVDLYFDADVEFYQANGSSVDATVLDIERVINAGDLIYRRDAGITQWIWGIIVRTGEPDPYSGSTAATLLCEFRTFWNANYDNRSRDTAHLMTGRNLSGNTIGLAWTGVVCNREGIGTNCRANDNLAYGLSQSRYTTTWSLRVSLTAHELGHNWNAGHCDGDNDCRIMCANNGACSGVVTSFGSRSRGAITTYKDDEADCLTGCWPTQFVPDDPETVFQAVRRACWDGGIVIDAGRYPETLRIRRAARLYTSGGTVIIGN